MLQALQANPIASLHEIHLATRISNPSLLRILNTLEHAGYVSRRLVDDSTASVLSCAWDASATAMIASQRRQRQCSITFAKRSAGPPT